jgi:hypothetical protein
LSEVSKKVTLEARSRLVGKGEQVRLWEPVRQRP